MNMINKYYQTLIREILNNGERLVTRNAEVLSHIDLPNIKFTEFPLVTVRKTAAIKAISEMEWFLSGESKCPEHLLDWWKEQLSPMNHLYYGYSEQFRNSTQDYGDQGVFDQVLFILKELQNHPNSRRLLISMWNPGEMSGITKLNNNQNTPTCCHSIVIQFFVRDGKLHIKTYQRSADLLLGVPHNWVQSWAMLLYFAYHTKLRVGSMTWMWGDVHIYQEGSHMFAANKIVNAQLPMLVDYPKLVYQPETVVLDSHKVPIFKASDFKIIGEIPQPLITDRINML